jgi:hypothetical protein
LREARRGFAPLGVVALLVLFRDDRGKAVAVANGVRRRRGADFCNLRDLDAHYRL